MLPHRNNGPVKSAFVLAPLVGKNVGDLHAQALGIRCRIETRRQSRLEHHANKITEKYWKKARFQFLNIR
jgi:hypothetical protein